MNGRGQQKTSTCVLPANGSNDRVLQTQTERIFRLAVVPRVFFRLQLGEIGISFQPLADHYLGVFVVGQFRQLMKDS